MRLHFQQNLFIPRYFGIWTSTLISEEWVNVQHALLLSFLFTFIYFFPKIYLTEIITEFHRETLLTLNSLTQSTILAFTPKVSYRGTGLLWQCVVLGDSRWPLGWDHGLGFVLRNARWQLSHTFQLRLTWTGQTLPSLFGAMQTKGWHEEECVQL